MAENHKETAKRVWRDVSESKRKQLLKAMGYKTEWARLSTLDEVVSRGGAMIAADMVRLLAERERRACART